jgi:hypothetical protein
MDAAIVFSVNDETLTRDGQRSRVRVFAVKNLSGRRMKFSMTSSNLRCCRVSIGVLSVEVSFQVTVVKVLVNIMIFSVAGQAFALRSEPHLCGVVLLTA